MSSKTAKVSTWDWVVVGTVMALMTSGVLLLVVGGSASR